MHDEGMGLSFGEEVGVDLISAELSDAIGGFLFFAHADPDVGVEDIGVGRGGGQVIGDDESTAGVVFGDGWWEAAGGSWGDDVWESAGDDFWGWLESGWGSDSEFEVEFGGGPEPRDWHIAGAVADKSDYFTGDGSEFFFDGLEIGDDLAGMFFVGQGVHRGNAGIGSEVIDIGLGEGADDGPVNHAAENSGGVFDGFAATELDIVGVEEEDIATEFTNSDFERDAGSGRAFGEEEGPALVAQGMFAVVASSDFHFLCRGEDGDQICGGGRFDGEKMFHAEGVRKESFGGLSG